MSLDKQTKAAIDNYSSKIESKRDFVDAVRSMPGMYLGHKGNRGFLTMFREIYQNAVDQLILSESPCNHIWIWYNEKTNEVIVEDNGFGIPFADMIRVYTREHTSKNYTKQLFQYSSGLHGVGGKCVNAVSSYFSVESYKYDGTAMRLDLEEGYPVKDPYKIPNPEHKQGTKVTFVPSTEVMGEISLPWESMYKLAKRIVSLTPLGSSVDFTAIDLKGKVIEEHIENKDGIITDLISRVKHPLIRPICIGADDGTRKLELAFCYDTGGESGPDSNESVIAFSNFCPTNSGTHIDGVLDGICRWFVSYMNNIFLLNQKAKEKIKVNQSDIKSGLNIFISAAHLYPVFTGQAKECLSNEDFLVYAKEVVMKGLDNWSKTNPQDLSKLARYFKDIAEVRQKSEASKAKIVTKYKQNVLSGMPDKYTKPLGKEHLELLIVEGDSAGGMAKDGRDKQRQGVFPIRGKMPNAFQKSYKEFWGNSEVQAIHQIMFGGKPYSRKLKAEDCKFEKIIIMADGDIDGSHISALVLRFFVLYYPQIIEAGLLYRVLPPLYSVTTGKGKAEKITYFTEQIDIVRYNQKNFIRLHELKHAAKGGKPLTGKELTVLFMKNTDYVYEMDRISTTYAVNPILLEIVLLNYYNKNSSTALKKKIKSSYRFMTVNKKNGVDIVEGTIDKSYKLYLTDKLISDCKVILDIIKENEACYYMLDGKECSLYEIMSCYENCLPAHLQRYKGLGEMDVDEIVESTMSPFTERTLIRYTFEDAKEEIEAIRQYESKLSKLLDLVGEVNRQDLLD